MFLNITAKLSQKHQTFYLFPGAPTSTELCDHKPTRLNARSTVAPLRAPVVPTVQNLITGPTAQWYSNVTGHPFMLSLPTGAAPLPLKRATPAVTRVAAFTALMLPTIKELVTGLLASEYSLATLSILLDLPTLALVDPTLSARRAGATMTLLSAAVDPTVKELRAGT